ncbi:hypothetical protein TH8_08545 [Thalassospira profundimaris]|nr:hypothetical protein TH8_08545 [Thalassospira profundimaris]
MRDVKHVPLPKLPKKLVPRYYVPLSLVYKFLRRDLSVTDRRLGRKYSELFGKYNFELVICFDLDLLIWPVSANSRSRLVFDAREYYPRQFEDRFLWKFVFGYYAHQLCKQLLRFVDNGITVSPGLKEAYKRNYGFETSVLLSLPDPAYLPVKRLQHGEKIRLIYHGNANPSRSIELMVQMVQNLDHRFEMDFMVLPEKSSYVEMLKRLAGDDCRIRFIPPQKMTDIVKFIHGYDIGVFLVPPKNFNLKHCLPNKFFEYIQASLAVAIGPSPDMQSIVEREKIGLVSESFDPLDLAEALNRVELSDINQWKQQSSRLARKLNSEKNFVTFKTLIQST